MIGGTEIGEGKYMKMKVPPVAEEFSVKKEGIFKTKRKIPVSIIAVNMKKWVYL